MNLYCMLAHDWDYRESLIEIKGVDVLVLVRYCLRCKKEQHHGMPSMNGVYNNWKDLK